MGTRHRANSLEQLGKLNSPIVGEFVARRRATSDPDRRKGSRGLLFQTRVEFVTRRAGYVSRPLTDRQTEKRDTFALPIFGDFSSRVSSDARPPLDAIFRSARLFARGRISVGGMCDFEEIGRLVMVRGVMYIPV